MRFLKTKYSQHAENLFVSGGQKCGHYLLEACSVDPDGLFKAVMVRNSAVLPSPPSYRRASLVLAEVETQNLSENETLSNVLQWVNLCRDADHLYASRLGGMLRLGDREEELDDLFF